ncbi:MAG: hypothetical protein QFX33_05165 [Candidatus Nezhaarchaeota archaeon]|nr:hypothetical protein [Candidatus Nezhaarchaeota archaeon]
MGEEEVYMKIPAGVPYSLLVEAAEKFNLKIVELELRVPPPDEGIYWNPRTLVLKGKREELERARTYIAGKLEERIRSLEEGRSPSGQSSSTP